MFSFLFAKATAEERQTRRELLTLAGPIAIALGGDTVMGLVDTKLVGALGADALGGVGLGVTLSWLGYSVVFGVMRGVKVRVAYAVGEGRAHDGFVYARAGMALGVALGVLMFVLGRDASPLLRWIGASPQLVQPAAEFLAALTCGAPALTTMVALVQHRQAIGDSRTPMLVGLVANVINGVLAYGMIHGHFGLPQLGVAGAGYATAIAQSVQLLALFALFVRDARHAPPSQLSVRQAAREVFTLGGPTGLQFGAETLAFTTFTAVLSSLSSAEIAAHQIAIAVNRTSFMPGLAIGEGASILVGTALGARDLARADRVNKVAIRTAVQFMAVCGVGFALFGRQLVASFTDDVSVLHIARTLLYVAAAFQVLDAINIVLRGSLRGAKDVHYTAVVGTLVVWGCVPTAAFVLGKWAGLGALGGWLGFLLETSLGSFFLWRRYHRAPWRAKYAPLPPEAPRSTPHLEEPVHERRAA